MMAAEWRRCENNSKERHQGVGSLEVTFAGSFFHTHLDGFP
jgi:hypothetical protein